MQRSVKIDLVDASEAVEQILANLEKLTFTDIIDVGARVHAILKNCATIDEKIKEVIKAKSKKKVVEYKGEEFKAVVSVTHPRRLDQTALRAAEPELVEKYTMTATQTNVSFKIR